MSRPALLISVLLLLDACIQQVTLPSLDTTPRLVVDGLITNEVGPHVVRLQMSHGNNESTGTQVPLTGATVTIIEDSAVHIPLEETHRGQYSTSSSFQAVVGHSYQLFISTSEGKKYHSVPSRLSTAGLIDRVYFEFKENVVNSDDLTQPQDAIDILVDASGTPAQQNFLRWRTHFTYQVRTFPELRTKDISPGPGTLIVPDPLPCSGYEVTEGGEMVPVRPCECCDCYIDEYISAAVTSSNIFQQQERFDRIHVARIPVVDWYFYKHLYIEIEQLSLDERVYEFWRLVETQQNSSRNIFQPNITRIRGNIVSENDPSEEVFGIFSVSGVTQKSISISADDLPKRVNLIDTLIVDCRRYFDGSTNQKPPYY